MEGYKQSEIGVIPEDWDAVLISELTSEVGDGIHSTPTYSSNGNYYFINGNNLDNGKIVVNQDTKRADLFEFKRHKRNLSDRSILLSINGTIGNLAFYQGESIILGKSAAYLNIKKEFSKQYVYFSLQTNSIKQSFEDRLTGTTIRNLGLGAIRNTLIPVPKDYREQKAIAQALSDVDAAIAELDRLITKKRNIKQGAMQQLLTGKKRLLGFSEEKRYKQTDIGVIPENWNVISIQAALDEKYIEDQMDGNHGELYPRSHEFVNHGIPYVGANDFLGGQVSFKNCKFLSEERAKKFKKGLARDGDVLFAHNATVGPVALLKFDGNFLIVSTTVTYFRCNSDKLDNWYFRYVLEAQYFVKQYSAVMAQSTRFQVPITMQRKFLIAVPNLREQKAIAQVLTDMDAEIEALEQKRDKYKAIKQGMMQELLTGRTRLI